MNGDQEKSSQLLDEKGLARELQVSLAALRRWRIEDRGPKFLKLGPLVRYRPQDVEAWLASRPCGGTEGSSPSTRGASS